MMYVAILGLKTKGGMVSDAIWYICLACVHERDVLFGLYKTEHGEA